MHIIGQQKLLNELNFDNKVILLVGRKGQGKKTIARYIAEKTNRQCVIVETTAQSIREMIEMANTITEPVLYVIPDIQDMNVAASNSFLKVLEEPPNNAKFVLTVNTMDNVLDTIKSRAFVYRMDEYTKQELEQMYTILTTVHNKNLGERIDNMEELLTFCHNYYELEMFISVYNFEEFKDFIDLVANSLHIVNSANSFKISNNIKIKDEDEGYDIDIFLNCMYMKYFKLAFEGDTDRIFYMNCVGATLYSINQLTIPGINKQAILDGWILTIRKMYREKRESNDIE